MTCEEFSNEFDVLVDSYRRFKSYDEKEQLDSIEFSEYEKSVFLTSALEVVVVNLYNGKLKGESFEESEELRANLRNIIKTAILTEDNSNNTGLTSNSKFYTLPSDVLFITYEQATLSENDSCLNGRTLTVVPIKLDDFHRTLNNPFKGPNSRRALRIDSGSNTVELISKYPITNYLIRYIYKPSPIILTDLVDVNIDGKQEQTECKLNSILHRYILEEAVRAALLSRNILSKDNV